MNISTLIGILFGGFIFYMGLHETSEDIMMFLDLHSTLIVIGGTTAAASISYPIPKVLGLLKVFVLRVLGKKKVDYQGTIAQMLELNKKAANGLTALNEAIPSIKHEFLKEAVQLVSSGVLTEREIRQVLEQRLKTVKEHYQHDADMFKNMAKYPPAFGLMATTLGMIALLQKIGQPDSQKMIGPAMSIGLIGTLYGITLANLVLSPIAQNLQELTNEEVALRKMIIEGAVMLRSQVNPIMMREGMNSFLLPKDRITRKAA